MPSFDAPFIEALLYEEEGVTLDFKREQYRFVHASDDDKSELLKDILAFANAWRRTDAFILVGVEDVKGGRSHILGLSESLEDAALQQFVNSKTQRPIAFSYRQLRFENHDIGLIQIPCQERPFYLKGDFGKLKANTVYIRRGSSTDVATPDEVAKMGAPATPSFPEPRLDVFFSDPSLRKRLETVPVIRSINLVTPDIDSIPNYEPPLSHPLVSIGLNRSNRHYYRELTHFTKVRLLVSPVYVAVTNHGEATAHDVRVELRLPGPDQRVAALDAATYPGVPVSEYPLLGPRIAAVHDVGIGYEVTVERVGTELVAEARAEKVQPKSTYWFQDPIYLGSFRSQRIDVAVKVFADNLQNPHEQSLSIEFQVVEQEADLKTIRNLERRRFLSSLKGRGFLGKQGVADEE